MPGQAGAAPVADAQLIDGGLASSGRYAGLRIRLPGDALTYWRDPGDAGVAPNFDFSKSDNLGSAEALFPVPARFDEAGFQAIGYKHEVVFLLRLSAKDPAGTIGLAVAVDYAVCAQLCIPAHADLRLDLPPQGVAPPGFAEYFARIPRPLDARETSGFASVARAGAAQWFLRTTTGVTDVFVEAPAGVHVESQRTPEGVLLTLDQRPASDAPPSLRFTLAGAAPVEFSLDLK
ncbi:hypothetical protein GGD83_003506 [Rhodoblastus sphagnicola]|uniref:protein-disulfide reductase DsbD domain-containing protein n=1 Tax=Rhodoblastus sphagnicola TaxID=333368 RepID=UPI001304DD65|nr:protein-disulfide reductase DsbD domain-containing protein [Rhodoblastus sphagnicola]MBB4199685.1 hypothetical protein [Rhodoblastus sphagnicola]